MRYWETDLADRPSVEQDFADMAGGRQGRVFQDAGNGLQRQDPDRARLRPRRGASNENASGARHRRGRPDLAAQALKAGLVDELHLFVTPIVVEVVNSPSPETSAWNSNCWTNTVSRTAWFTSTTAPGRN